MQLYPKNYLRTFFENKKYDNLQLNVLYLSVLTTIVLK